MKRTLFLMILAISIGLISCKQDVKKDTEMKISAQAIQKISSDLKSKYPKVLPERIEKGITQASLFWRTEDGTAEEFEKFCSENFLGNDTLLEETFTRLQKNFELIYGYNTELNRDLTISLQEDTGPILPVDYMFGEFSPSVHFQDDFFKTKIAFVALLNFPSTTLEERIEKGKTWTREEWAKVRLGQYFTKRVPSDASQKVAEALNKADNYISSYNIYMHNLLNDKGERIFPEGKILLSHWNLRDELKAQYQNPDGRSRQDMICTVMERIVRQEIPKAVVNNPDLDWNPLSNQVTKSPTAKPDTKADNTAEPNTRYEIWQNVFKAELEVDKYYPQLPTMIDRKFKEEREIPEAQFENLLKSVLSSPFISQTGVLIEKRLGRKLTPFDIWYNGFKPEQKLDEAQLDKIVKAKYPNVAAFEKDVPNILTKLGFSYDMAQFIAGKIEVDPARGSGHAMAAGRLVDKAHLRTRVPKDGMNYKGYNIAMHELGHNVEQVLSFNKVDYTLLRGVPNTAFTEGFAFVFQSRDMDILGFKQEDKNKDALDALNSLWMTYEISGVALIDMYSWHWMYKNPAATPAQFKDAVIQIAKDVWNQYYAPVFGKKDVILLAVYSHLIHSALYVPDYPLGHIIAFQVEEYLKNGNLAKDMERMCTQGSVTPNLWMEKAVGQPISTKPMLDAAEKALKVIQ
jgi:hypothetical protein